MSNLFSCFVCTKKGKHKLNDNQNEDKLPKAKKQKKMKTKKSKNGKDVEDKTIPLNNHILPQSDACKLEHQAGVTFDSHTEDVHLDTVKVDDDDEAAGDAFKFGGIPSDDFESKVPNIDDGDDDDLEMPRTRAKAENLKPSSEGESSDVASCLTDSDLNISEAVFITEEGPRVGSLGASLSRMGLQAVRATMENERRLEKDLLDRASANAKPEAAPQWRLSLENGKIQAEKEEVNGRP